MIKSSGITGNFLDIGFKEFGIEGRHESIKNAKVKAIKYYKAFKDIRGSRRNSISFLSKNTKGKKTGIGTGKTHLSIAIANNIMKAQGVSAVYMSYRDTITKLKQNMIDEEYYQKELNRYKKADLLLIDDLFKGKVNETDINIMFEIINHRYLNHLPIICSSELGVNELVDFDEAVGSRIVEMSKDYLIEIGLTPAELDTIKTINYRLT